MEGYCSITIANHGLSWLIRFISQFTTHPCKKIANRFYLVLHAYVQIFDVTFLGVKFWDLNIRCHVLQKLFLWSPAEQCPPLPEIIESWTSAARTTPSCSEIWTAYWISMIYRCLPYCTCYCNWQNQYFFIAQSKGKKTQLQFANLPMWITSLNPWLTKLLDVIGLYPNMSSLLRP